ncbi:MAG: phosphoglycolate phosphatase [Sulfolobales archaeon]
MRSSAENSTRIRAVITDIDGTLTQSSESYVLHIGAVEIIRRIVREGYIVVLASGNSIPMVLGLARYIGSSDIVIAENGGAIAYENEIKWLCKDSERDKLVEFEDLVYREGVLRDRIRRGWQNDFMRCSKAFKILRKDERAEEIKRIMMRIAEERGFKDLLISYSGFAIHVNPVGCSKAEAAEKLLNLYSISWDETLAIGDSEIDLEMIRRAGYGCLIASKYEENLKWVGCTSSRRAGEGFIEIIEKILGFKLES